MPMLLPPVSTLTKPRLNKNDLIGYVIDNVDPDKRQRVRIRCPQLHRNVPDNLLPWTIPDRSDNYSNAGKGVGSVNVPPIGSKVYYRLDENDPHNPRYGGSPATDDVNKEHEMLNEKYPHTRGNVDSANNRRASNNEKETVDFVHSSGTTQHVASNGAVNVNTAGNMKIGVRDVLVLAANKKIELIAPRIILTKKKPNLGSLKRRKRKKLDRQQGKVTY